MQAFLKVIVLVLLIAFIMPAMLGMRPLSLDVKLKRIQDTWSGYYPPQEVILNAPTWVDVVGSSDNFLQGIFNFVYFVVLCLDTFLQFVASILDPFILCFQSFCILAFNAAPVL